MGSLNSHEEQEVEVTPVADEGTPIYRDMSRLDPRSPTLEIVRTPLEVPQAHRSRLRRLVSLLDPRSPSQHLNRTPLQFQRPIETKPEPLDDQKPQAAEANVSVPDEDVKSAPQDKAVDLGAADSKCDSADLKLARALFFGDLSLTDSPIANTKNLKSQAKASCQDDEDAIMGVDGVKGKRLEMAEEEGKEEEAKDALEAEEEDEERMLKKAGEEQEEAKDAMEAETETKHKQDKMDADDVVEAEGIREAESVVAVPTKPLFAGVKRAELGSLPRRPDKENVRRKQLTAADTARVRTPLSNVASFHNSPLRR